MDLRSVCSWSSSLVVWSAEQEDERERQVGLVLVERAPSSHPRMSLAEAVEVLLGWTSAHFWDIPHTGKLFCECVLVYLFIYK